MKTYLPPVHEIERKWHLVDAEEHVLGRLASRIASVLMGKEKPCYTDFLDNGDFLIVINADKVKLTGEKVGKQDILFPQWLSWWSQADQGQGIERQAS